MSDQSLRIWRSPYCPFRTGDVLTAPKAYTTEVLRGIREAGFNAIWIRGILRDLVRTRVFPELGADSAAHLRALRTVIERAAKEGVKVFLYMQPPLGLPAGDPFWRKHPEAKGEVYSVKSFSHVGKDTAAMCVSAEPVRRFLRQASRELSRRLPELGGLILITASEFISHCYSHKHVTTGFELDEHDPRRLTCPRCIQRRPADVIGDILHNIKAGLDDAGNGAEMAAWNWSWSFYEPDPAPGVIANVPDGVRLMAGFERGGVKTILGKERKIDEYSLGYAGPSERFMATLKAARRRGLKVMAKLQLGTTHELATVPNLPLIGGLYDKAKAMRRLKVTDFLGCWNFGNMLTANTAAITSFLDADRLPPRTAALRRFADDYMPGCDAPAVVRAWDAFAAAMDNYPFCIPFLYYSPVNYAVQHPLTPGPTTGVPVGNSWLADKVRGDDVARTLGPFTLKEVITGLGLLTQEWEATAADYAEALAGSECAHAEEELNTARVAGHCFHSAWNHYRAYALRKNWKDSHLKRFKAIARDEREHLVSLVPILKADPRQGFHSECQHQMFSAAKVQRKLRELNRLLAD